jgi:hypothetical protein
VKDLAPWGGAGSFSAHLARSKKQYRPTDARARLTEAERKQFAAENQEPIYTSPEERERIDALVADTLKRDDIKRHFADAVRKNQPLEDLWTRAGGEGTCPLFEGIERDGDPTGAPEAQIIAAWKTFAESPVYAAYFTTEKNSARGKTQVKIQNLLWAFMSTNLVNMTLPGSWAASFALLKNMGVMPAPVPTDAQLKAADAARLADDGNAVAINDVSGEPVTYKFRDGRVVFYSAQMLSQLNAESYAKVLGIRKSPVELAETEDQRRQRKAKEYRTVPVIKGYTQQQLDQMPSEQYRQLLELSRAPMAMAPRTGL